MLVSIDGGATFVDMNEVRVIYNVTGGDEDQDVHVHLNARGVVVNVIGVESGEVTSSTAMDVEDLISITE